MKRKDNRPNNPATVIAEKIIVVTRDGDWLPLPELLQAALAAMEEPGELCVQVQDVDHLDAGVLQILLALGAECQERGRGMRLANTSPTLAKWFAYAGGGRSSLCDPGAPGNA